MLKACLYLGKLMRTRCVVVYEEASSPQLVSSIITSVVAADGSRVQERLMEITYATSSNLDLADGVVGMDMAAWEVRSERPWPSLHSSSAPPVSRWWSSLKAMTATEWLEMLLPCTRWICRYRSGDYLELDLTAGVTVGVMLVPQVKSSSILLLVGFEWVCRVLQGRLPCSLMHFDRYPIYQVRMSLYFNFSFSSLLILCLNIRN